MICTKCAHKFHTGCRGGTWCDCQHHGPEDRNEYIRYLLRKKSTLTLSVPVKAFAVAREAENRLRDQMSVIASIRIPE